MSDAWASSSSTAPKSTPAAAAAVATTGTGAGTTRASNEAPSPPCSYESGANSKAPSPPCSNESRAKTKPSSAAPAPVTRPPAGRPNNEREPGNTPLKNPRSTVRSQWFSFPRRKEGQEVGGGEGGSNDAERCCCYAIDAEMVQVVGPGNLPPRRAIVSVGVVNERLETLLHARVAVPKGCKVTDGAFARYQGRLWTSWEEGIPASCVSDFLYSHAIGGGVLVGWEIHNDLQVVGFKKAAKEIKNGGRENLPVERVPIDGGSDPSLKQSATPLSPRSPPGSGEGGGAAGDVDLQTGAGDKMGNGDGDAPPRGTSRAFRLSGERQGVSLRTGEPRKGAPGSQGSTVGAERGGTRREKEVTPAAAGVNAMKGRKQGSMSGECDATGVEDAAKVGLEEPKAQERVGEEGARSVGGGSIRVVEVTDVFRTTKGVKCTLAEAYACCFDRPEEGWHDAVVDARMTMELYNLWKRAGKPERPLGLPLSLYVVNFHSFKPSRSRQATLWNVLRLDGMSGCHRAVERDSGSNTYKLTFRTERGREAYLDDLQRKMKSVGLDWEADREIVPSKWGAEDGYQLSCRSFKMHVLEHER